jgi:hypothetical protein
MTDERHDVNDVASDELDGLASALDVLRETPTVSAAWRANLTTALRAEAAAHSMQSRRGWSITMHPLMALAAGVACIAIGASGARLFGPGLDSRGPRATGIEANTSVPLRPVTDLGGDTFGVRFAVVAPAAQRVSVVGDFNGWDPQATPLVRSRDGSTWTTMLPMSAGRHTYAFVIDGDVVPDPAAPSSPDDDFGIPNSVLVVVKRP